MKKIVSLIVIFQTLTVIPIVMAADHTNPFQGMQFPGSTVIVQSPYNNSEASLVHAQGGYAIDMTIAGMNSQKIESMAMDNHLKRIDTFFQGRINNMYYRDMEDWRRKERGRLKSLGQYDGDAIRKLYGK